MLEALIVELPVRVSVPLLVSTLVEPPPYTVRLVAVLLFPPVASIALVPVRFTAPEPVSVATAGLPTTFNAPMFNIRALLSVPPVRFAVVNVVGPVSLKFNVPALRFTVDTVVAPVRVAVAVPLLVRLSDTIVPPIDSIPPEKVMSPDPVIDFPVSVLFCPLLVPSSVCVPAAKLMDAPGAVLNVPVWVMMPALLSVSVPTFPFTVPPLLNSTLMLPPVGAP